MLLVVSPLQRSAPTDVACPGVVTVRPPAWNPQVSLQRYVGSHIMCHIIW